MRGERRMIRRLIADFGVSWEKDMAQPSGIG